MKPAMTLTAATLALLFLAGAAQAQTLSLTPAVSTASAGDTVTFFVVLSDGPKDTSSLSVYEFTLSADNNYVSFASPAAPFTLSSASGFTDALANEADKGAGTLHVSYGAGLSGLVNEEGRGPLTLGTFSVTVKQTLLVGGTALTFGSVSDGTSTVVDGGTFDNVLQGTSGATLLPAVAPAPEPSGAVALLTGGGLLALRAARRRVRASLL